MCMLSNPTVPIVYACSGASNLAQLANDIGLWLHQQGHAQMSAVAGLAGFEPDHLRGLREASAIVAIDGCDKACVKRCIELHNGVAKWHINLAEVGIEKETDQVCSLQQTFAAMQYVSERMGIQAEGHFSDHLKAPNRKLD